MDLIARRIADIEDLLAAYALRMGAEPDEDPAASLAGLLSDLRHWACMNDVVFDDAWNTGESHWRSEIGGEEDRSLDLSRADADLYRRLVSHARLSSAEWERIHTLLALPTTKTDCAWYQPLPPMPDPPLGIIDNVYRAARVNDLMDALMTRINISEPDVALAEFLTCICHYGTARHMTLAPPHAAYADEPRDQRAHLGQTAYVWQEGMRFFVEELHGVDMDADVDVRGTSPVLAAAIDPFMTYRPRSSEGTPALSSADWLALNQLMYWARNRDAQRTLPAPRSLAAMLFDPDGP